MIKLCKVRWINGFRQDLGNGLVVSDYFTDIDYIFDGNAMEQIMENYFDYIERNNLIPSMLIMQGNFTEYEDCYEVNKLDMYAYSTITLIKAHLEDDKIIAEDGTEVDVDFEDEEAFALLSTLNEMGEWYILGTISNMYEKIQFNYIETIGFEKTIMQSIHELMLN